MFESLNSTQILLCIMIVLLGVTLIIVGIQLFFVLKDLRKSLVRTDRVLADMEQITSKIIVEQQYVDETLENTHHLMKSVSSGTNVLNSFTKYFGPASIGMSFIKGLTAVLNKKEPPTSHHGS